MSTNKDTTLVSVHCYAGDQHQVEGALPYYMHHGCEVVVVSADDSRATFGNGAVTHLYAGGGGYIGQGSLDRQLAQMDALLREYPTKMHFLMHDADSIMLTPDIPEYLYETDVLWSNQVDDAIPEHQGSFPSGWPHVAFQPPYFCSRAVLQKLVDTGKSGHPYLVASPMMPFIDFYMVQLATVGGVPWARIRDAISCPIGIPDHKVVNAHDRQVFSDGFKIALDHVLNKGTTVLHAVKNPRTLDELAQAHVAFKTRNPHHQPKQSRPPRIGGGAATNATDPGKA